MGWLDKLSSFAGSLGTIATDGVGGGVADVLSAVVDKLIEGESLYLYLVDEYTMQPVVDPDGVYPIKITTTKETVTKLLPLMKVRHYV